MAVGIFFFLHFFGSGAATLECNGPCLTVLSLEPFVSFLTEAAHECERPCVVGDNRICLYDFRLQEYYTLSRACYNCPENLADCLREECIVGDGVGVPLLAVNRQLPGPSLQVLL